MTALLDVMAVRATGDPAAAVVECGAPGPGVEETRCDVLVVGGGTGGIAAALAAARAGRRVCLLEETDWIGGQLTAQGVSALDEHEHIERFGGTRSYYALREAIRAHYRRLSPALAAEPHANPGRCWVTRLAFEPRVAVDSLHAMAAAFRRIGPARHPDPDQGGERSGDGRSHRERPRRESGRSTVDALSCRTS